jgi:hypothetical protein
VDAIAEHPKNWVGYNIYNRQCQAFSAIACIYPFRGISPLLTRTSLSRWNRSQLLSELRGLKSLVGVSGASRD